MTGPRPSALPPRGRLTAACALLLARLDSLEARLAEGDEVAWAAYTDTVRTLAAVAECVQPGAAGELLTTRQMAESVGLAPKTLLRHKARGAVRPAFQRGKLIRWRGDEVPR